MLSYAGRCQLIKSVIFGIQTYWAQVFILPKKVLKAIETICRTFPWTGSVKLSRKVLVDWDSVCRPLSAGGLNIIDMTIWNKAAIIKHLWNLANKKDCLWIRWVHGYYIKQRDLETMSSPKTASWVVKKILDRREDLMGTQLSQGNLFNRLQAFCRLDKFLIHKLYLALTPTYSKVAWRNLVLFA